MNLKITILNQNISRHFMQLILLGFMLFCSTSKAAETMENSLETYSTKLGSFAFNLFSQLTSMKPNENIVFSPFSIQACGAMARLGATGETAKQLDQGLVLPSSDLTQLSSTFHNVLSKYENSSILKIANKIYVMKDYKVKQHFNELTTKNFFSGAEEIDFSASADAALSMNKWIESKTNNLIRNLISPSAIDQYTRLVLLNAIHFKGEWLNPFMKDKTRQEPFYLDEVKSVQVPMMNLKARFRYADLPELDAKVLELPYKNSDLSMLIVLPVSRTGLKTLESQLKGYDWSSITDKMYHQQVLVKLPKFKAEFSIELSEAFKKLGMDRMFTDNAEFGNMLEAKDSLRVSQVIHKAFIDVNEEGTEAAAATGFIFMEMSARPSKPKQFAADHPFIYAIISRENIPFFVGTHLRSNA